MASQKRIHENIPHILRCVDCGRVDPLLIASCGCLYCTMCRNVIKNTCKFCQLEIEEMDVRVFFPRACKQRDHGCSNMAQFLCKCVRDGYLCSTCLAELHSRRVSTKCVPEMVEEVHDKKRDICQDCGEFWAEYKTTSGTSKNICLECKSKYEAFDKLPETTVKLDMAIVKKDYLLTKRIVSCLKQKIEVNLRARNKTLLKETEKVKDAIQQIESNFLEYKKAFEEENMLIKNQETKIMKIVSKFDSDGSITRIMSALDSNLVHIQGGTESLTSLFSAFRRENFLPKPIKRARFTFNFDENLYQAINYSLDSHGSHESPENDEAATQNKSVDESEIISTSTSVADTSLPKTLKISSSTQVSVANHEPLESSTKILPKEKNQDKYVTRVQSNTNELSLTQTSTRRSFNLYQYESDSYPSPLIPVRSQESTRATITRILSPFYICIEIPELIETRILNLQRIKEHVHDWKPIEHFDYGDKVIVQDLQSSTEPLKRGRIKFIARHNGTVRVYLLDFGFDIMVGFNNIGEIPGLEFNSEDTCFLAKLAGIKPLSGFIFPTGIRKCATNFLNMLAKKHGTRVILTRKYEHDEYTFVEIKSRFSGVEQDWSRLLIDNGYALPYNENDSCFIPLKDYCYRFHALNECSLCTRVHQCPYCNNNHSLVHCHEFQNTLAQEN